MPVVNPLARELVFKVVYYGPGLGGKTTSLQHIHATTRAEHRGKMVSLATPVDRTLYFDFLPIRVPSSRDMTIRLQLFTVPGQVYYNATRKLVLTGADGVVFVVDSQRARADANIESFRNLEENLVEHGRALDEIPHVFSYNKRDLPGLVPIDDMERLLNPHGAPSFATVATTGEGVYETLEAITRAVLEDFEHRMPEHRGLSPSPLMLPEGGLAEALRHAEDAPSAARVIPKRATVAVPTAAELAFSLPPAEDVGEQAARELVEPGTSPGLGATETETPIELLRAKHPQAKTALQELVPELSPEVVPELAGESITSPLDAMSRVVATLSGGFGRKDAARGADGLEPRIDTRHLISDVAPAASPADSDALPQDTANPDSVTDGTAAAGVSKPAAAGNGFSLSTLWAEDERAAVLRVEESIQFAELRDAVLLIDVLVQRCLETHASTLGTPTLDMSLLMLLLGTSGDEILEFRRTCESARGTARRLTEEDAKTALLFATNLQLRVRRTRR